MSQTTNSFSRKRTQVQRTSISLGLGEDVLVSTHHAGNSDIDSDSDESHLSIKSLDDENTNKKFKLDETDQKVSPAEAPFKSSMDPTKCWGCIHKLSKTRVIGKYPIIDDMYNILEENKDIPLEQVAQMIEKFYFEKIVKKKLYNKDQHILLWTAKEIMVHLTQHDIEPARIIQEDIRTLIKLKNIVDKNIVHAENEVDASMVKTAMLIRQQMMSQIAALKNVPKL